MDKHSIRAVILPFILDNQLDRAFQFLVEQARTIDRLLENEAILLQSKWNQNRKKRILGTYASANLDVEFNQIKASLLDFLETLPEEVASNEKVKIAQVTQELETAMTSAGEKIKQTTVRWNGNLPNNKKYLADWLIKHQTSLCKLTARMTLDLLESKEKDAFQFKGDLVVVLRLIFKSYIFDSEDWLDSPAFLFDTAQFSKTEIRVAFLFLKYQLCRNSALLPKDKDGLISMIDRLDGSFAV